MVYETFILMVSIRCHKMNEQDSVREKLHAIGQAEKKKMMRKCENVFLGKIR